MALEKDLKAEDFEPFLKGLSWPAERDDILTVAVEQGMPDELLVALNHIGDGRYNNIEDVAQEVRGRQPSIASPDFQGSVDMAKASRDPGSGSGEGQT